MAPPHDLNAYYKKALLEAWLRALMDHAYKKWPTAFLREEFIECQLAILAHDFDATLSWDGGEVVRIEEIR